VGYDTHSRYTPDLTEEALSDTPTERDCDGAWVRLRRRKVLQWGLAYAAGAWALLQVIGFAADAFHWPDVAKQLSMLTLAIGLPVAMTLAWYHGDRGELRHEPARGRALAQARLGTLAAR
jgi:hypothetical protein